MAAGALPDLPDQQTPAMPGIQGMPTAPPAAAASPSQPASPGAGATPPLAQPQAGRTIEQGTGKGEIATPAVKLKFNADKLKGAQTTLDVLNAATSTSRKEYMDWWQKQHGDIDDKYDNMRSQLGARPSDDEPQTKKEKFAALLEFGLHLMKNSAQATSNQGAVLSSTLSDEHDAMQKAHADKIAGAQGKYDAQAGAIESGREEEQKGIGTPAQAMKASADQAKDDSAATKDQAQSLKALADAGSTKANALGTPTYIQRPDGSILLASRDEDGKPVVQPLTGIDGKPIIGKVLGRTAGSGIDKSGQDPAAVRTYKYATGVLGMDHNAAAPILGIKRSGNPAADHAAVYKATMAATMGDDEKAKRVADQYTLDNYGAAALSLNTRQAVPNNPPAQALSGLKPGMVRDFGANGKWTVGIDGKPIRVGSGPQSIQ